MSRQRNQMGRDIGVTGGAGAEGIADHLGASSPQRGRGRFEAEGVGGSDGVENGGRGLYPPNNLSVVHGARVVGGSDTKATRLLESANRR